MRPARNPISLEARRVHPGPSSRADAREAESIRAPKAHPRRGNTTRRRRRRRRRDGRQGKRPGSQQQAVAAHESDGAGGQEGGYAGWPEGAAGQKEGHGRRILRPARLLLPLREGAGHVHFVFCASAARFGPWRRAEEEVG